MTKIQKALMKAYELHKSQFRKGGDEIPYFVHIIDVARFLMYETKNQDIICAGILHDTLEDTSYTAEELLAEFGQKVHDLVLSNTEPGNNINATHEEQKKSWKARKSHSIERLKDATYEEALVILADKSSNLLSIKEDLAFGKDVWKLFRAPKDEVQWYYESIRDGVRDKVGETRLFKVFETMFDVFQ